MVGLVWMLVAFLACSLRKLLLGNCWLGHRAVQACFFQSSCDNWNHTITEISYFWLECKILIQQLIRTAAVLICNKQNTTYCFWALRLDEVTRCQLGGVCCSSFYTGFFFSRFVLQESKDCNRTELCKRKKETTITTKP